MKQPPLPAVPPELRGPLSTLLWAAHVLQEAVEDVLLSPEQHLLQGKTRALYWAEDLVEQWIDHVELQDRKAAAQEARRDEAALDSVAGTGHEPAAALASNQEDVPLTRRWPPTPERYFADIKALVQVGSVFRGALVRSVSQPLEEVLVKDDDALILADDCLNGWVNSVGVEHAEMEDVRSESILLAEAMCKAARGELGDKGKSKGKGKPLRKGGKRGTVKRR